VWLVVEMKCIISRGSYRSGKTGKSQSLSGQGKVRGNFFLQKSGNTALFAIKLVKLVPPDVRYSGKSASISISAGAPPQTPLGELTALPQIP